MPPRPRFQILALRPRRNFLSFRPFAQQPARNASSQDPKLHPNPSVTPSTDPSSGTPSSNPARTDSQESDHSYDAAQSNIDPKGPNMEQLPHVNEEAAAMSKSMSEAGPAVEQGTPVQDVLKNEQDKEAYDRLPKVIKDSIAQGQRRGFSTSTRRRVEFSDMIRQFEDEGPPPGMDVQAAKQQQAARVPSREEQEYPGQYHEITEEEAIAIAKGELPHPLEMRKQAQVIAQERQGLKFAAPSTPVEKQRHLKRRYEGVIEQVTNLIMRHGKKSVAQRNISEILNYLRTAPSPSSPPANTPRRLLPLPTHTPTPSHLPLHPVYYLTHAIDSIAPLLRIRAQRGLAGGGVALQIPAPLNIRQRRRAAIVWILDAVDKRKGGTSGFARRFAEEIVAIVEGRSSVWVKRENAHRMAVMGRSNLASVRGGRR